VSQPAPADPGPTRRRRRRLPLVLGLVGALLVVSVAVVLPRALRPDPDPSTGTRTGVSIEGLQVFTDRRTDHTRRPVSYSESPPVGGPHDRVWLDCGVYDEPLRNENAVHDLEHGSVWIAYHPDLAPQDVQELVDLLPDNAIMAPYPDLYAPIVLTVWERQLAVDAPDDARIEQFLTQLGGGETAPEGFVTCQGGSRDPNGPNGPDVVEG